jgi:hypothetical protein
VRCWLARLVGVAEGLADGWAEGLTDIRFAAVWPKRAADWRVRLAVDFLPEDFLPEDFLLVDFGAVVFGLFASQSWIAVITTAHW